MFQSLDGFFFLLSSDGRILFISENSTKYVGYSQVRSKQTSAISKINIIHRLISSEIQYMTSLTHLTNRKSSHLLQGKRHISSFISW